MRHLLPFLTLLFMATGCSRYQYVTLSSPSSNMLKDSSRSFVFENDTLQVVYNFNGRWGKIQMLLRNKSSEPMVVDWTRSALIHQGRSYDLYDPNVPMTGELTKPNELVVRDSVIGSFSASFRLPKGADFIPPNTNLGRKEVITIALRPSLLPLPDTLPEQKAQLDYGRVQFRRKTFTLAESPFQFQLYLTLIIGNKNEQFALVHTFYASDIVERKTGPDTYFIQADGDKFMYALPL